MEKFLHNNQYRECVEDIISRDSFKRFESIRNNKHHGILRYEHCFKVSYYSYLICKILNKDYKKAAIAGLLHDFYNTRTKKRGIPKIKEILFHSKIAAKNSKYLFGINDDIAYIIENHMFPLKGKAPKDLEGAVISIVDKIVSIIELIKNIFKRNKRKNTLY